MAPSKRKRTNEWSQNYLLTNPSSRIGQIDLFKVLSNPEAWTSLSQEEQASLLALCPPALIENPSDGAAPRICVDSPHFRHALHVFQEDLTNGRFDPKWLARAADAMEERARGDFEAYRQEQRILLFGDPGEQGNDENVHSSVGNEDTLDSKQLAEGPKDPDQSVNCNGPSGYAIDPVLLEQDRRVLQSESEKSWEHCKEKEVDQHEAHENMRHIEQSAGNFDQSGIDGYPPEYGIDPSLAYQDFGVPLHHNEPMHMREENHDEYYADQDYQAAQALTIPVNVEFASKIKLDVLVRDKVFIIGDIFVLKFKLKNNKGVEVEIMKEAKLTGLDKHSFPSFSFPPGLNLISPAADGRPDRTVTSITGPSPLEKAMLEGDGGSKIGKPVRRGWKTFDIRRGATPLGNLWDIRQEYHGAIHRLESLHALPGQKAIRQRRCPPHLRAAGYRYRNGVFQYVDPFTKEVLWADPSALEPSVRYNKRREPSHDFADALVDSGIGLDGADGEGPGSLTLSFSGVSNDNQL